VSTFPCKGQVIAHTEKYKIRNFNKQHDHVHFCSLPSFRQLYLRKINVMLRNYHSLTVQKKSQELNMDLETVRLLLMKYLNIKKVCAKLVLKATKEKSKSSSESCDSHENGSRDWKRAPCGPGHGGKSGVPESLWPLGSSLADRGAQTSVQKCFLTTAGMVYC
jgi:hypothetical protein